MRYLTDETIDPAELFSRDVDPTAGAIATFCGVVRNHHDGRAVRELFYESYRPMAESQIGILIAEARQRWTLRNVQVRHRVGRLRPGETAVLVAVWSDHRAEAFEACRFLIDEIKLRVPIWKHETYTDGTSAWGRCHEVSLH